MLRSGWVAWLVVSVWSSSWWIASVSLVSGRGWRVTSRLVACRIRTRRWLCWVSSRRRVLLSRISSSGGICWIRKTWTTTTIRGIRISRTGVTSSRISSVGIWISLTGVRRIRVWIRRVLTTRTSVRRTGVWSWALTNCWSRICSIGILVIWILSVTWTRISSTRVWITWIRISSIWAGVWGTWVWIWRTQVCGRWIRGCSLCITGVCVAFWHWVWTCGGLWTGVCRCWIRGPLRATTSIITALRHGVWTRCSLWAGVCWCCFWNGLCCHSLWVSVSSSTDFHLIHFV